MSFLIGLPVRTILSAGKNLSIPSYAVHIRLALFPRILFASPAKLFCSCIRVGIPLQDAIQSRGALAYPPTPIAMSGLNESITLPAITILFSSLNGRARLDRASLRCSPATGSPIILNPAAGTFSISILPSAPTNSISLCGFASFSLCAIDRAGKICPPVPPPLMIALIFLYCPIYILNVSSVIPGCQTCQGHRARLLCHHRSALSAALPQGRPGPLSSLPSC